MSDDLLKFMDEEDAISESEVLTKLSKPWRKVLVVDDEEDMHIVTRLALRGLSFGDCQVVLLHAYSGHDAYRMLQEQDDIAVVLLDVVMESDFAGLELVRKIREELFLEKVRIILRTGQPGYAPELDTIRRFDINDYRAKTELTRERLYACLMTALRSYEQLEQLESLAYKDTLTQVLNRNGLMYKLNQILISTDTLYSLVLVDIDQFSLLNDNFGPLHGDDFLVAFASKLTQLQSAVLVARLAADQFALLLPSPTSEVESQLQGLKSSLSVNSIEHQSQFCAGVADWNHKITASELVSHATIALKKAKKAGLNQCVIFTEVMVQVLRERATMLASLQQDFHKDRLFLVYQPQLDLNQQHVIGIEALVRWQDVSGHMVSPEVFIELAEHSGLIIQLGQWILRKALAETKSLLVAQAGMRVGVNVSAVQFHQDNFVDIVQSALQEHNLAGRYLNLEITESVGILGSSDIEARLQALKQLGVTISIDDFGTGFSSLSYLDNLSADCLKIDRSFITKLDSSSGQGIAKMIVGLGRHLGMQVLAEGIETHQQLENLTDMGCDLGQGYYFARPMTLKELQHWLAYPLGQLEGTLD